MEEIWVVKNYVHANVAVFVLSYRNIVPNREAEVYFIWYITKWGSDLA